MGGALKYFTEASVTVMEFLTFAAEILLGDILYFEFQTDSLRRTHV